MHTLKIEDSDGKTVLQLSIPEVDPMEANIILSTALRNMTVKKRKTRSDAGKTRTPEAGQ